jgi:hypothetical protein
LVAGKSTLNCPHLSRDTCFGELVRGKRPKKCWAPVFRKISEKTDISSVLQLPRFPLVPFA